MLNKVYLVGANGNMGKRYQAVLKWIRLPYKTRDLDHDEGIEGCDGVIIATPTYTHEALAEQYMHTYPVLCEKPIWTQRYNFYTRFSRDDEGMWRAKDFRDYSRLRMLNQYRHVLANAQQTRASNTYYNYYKHGGDGLIFDCINIYGNMKDFETSNVELKEESPVWGCCIDGKILDLADMDQAYVTEIFDWVRNPTGNLHYMCEAHHRAFQLLDQFQ
jgi:hypothetical protein